LSDAFYRNVTRNTGATRQVLRFVAGCCDLQPIGALDAALALENLHGTALA